MLEGAPVPLPASPRMLGAPECLGSSHRGGLPGLLLSQAAGAGLSGPGPGDDQQRTVGSVERP